MGKNPTTLIQAYDPSFLETDNEIRSYFLGLFISDGNLSKISEKGYRVAISLKDKQLICALADSVAIGRYIYADATIQLKRKYNKYLEGEAYRPSERGYGEKNRKQFLRKYQELLLLGYTSRNAAKYLGLDRSLLYRWGKRYA